jgi:hypothetical protein
MSLIDLSPYTRARRTATNAYAADSAMRAYARLLSQQRGARQITDLNKQYADQTPRLMASYGQRNLAGPNISSGIYSRGLQDFAAKQYSDANSLQSRINEQLQKIDLQQTRARESWQNRLADIEMQKQAKIAQTAAQINRMKPLMGG